MNSGIFNSENRIYLKGSASLEIENQNLKLKLGQLEEIVNESKSLITSLKSEIEIQNEVIREKQSRLTKFQTKLDSLVEVIRLD